jgi:hypothetical protein
MGRPLTGSLRQRGALWRASVPRLDDPRKRVETTFAEKAGEAAWVSNQLDRRAQVSPRGLNPCCPCERRWP